MQTRALRDGITAPAGICSHRGIVITMIEHAQMPAQRISEDQSRPIRRIGGELSGLKALVTGASRGIGREIAMALAEQGADVAINYNRSDEDADTLAMSIEVMGKNTWVYPADISEYSQVQAMKSSLVKYLGPIDILVNNAGINVDKLFAKMEPEDWNKVLATNLIGVFNCTRVFLEDLLSSKHGRIINITSIIGQMGNIGQVNYAASKAGIIGMTKSLAKELASKGVTVNAIAPGFIETSMLAGVPDKIKEKILAQIPMRRFGQPSEVAKAVVFLASGDASYITGHVLNVNGGQYL
jgi:3-oxoacyl-[acyl-carrier protein] reductase